jgi:hypothetical protein
MDPGIELEDKQAARSKPLHYFDNPLIKALENRSHSDDRRGSDQHAQDSQESTELMAAERVQREQEVFANRLASLGHA